MTVNDGSADVQASQAVSLVSLHVQLGKIEGILQTVVAEHARRLSGLDDITNQLRIDLTAVKESTQKDISSLKDAVQFKWDEGAKQGQAELTRINNELANLANGRRENREDIQEIRDKQQQTWPKTLAIMSTLASVGLFVLALVYK